MREVIREKVKRETCERAAAPTRQAPHRSAGFRRRASRRLRGGVPASRAVRHAGAGAAGLRLRAGRAAGASAFSGRVAPPPLPPRRRRHPRRTGLLSRNARAVPYDRSRTSARADADPAAVRPGRGPVRDGRRRQGRDHARLSLAARGGRCANGARPQGGGRWPGAAAPPAEEPPRALFAMDFRRVRCSGCSSFRW